MAHLPPPIPSSTAFPRPSHRGLSSIALPACQWRQGGTGASLCVRGGSAASACCAVCMPCFFWNESSSCRQTKRASCLDEGCPGVTQARASSMRSGEQRGGYRDLRRGPFARPMSAVATNVAITCCSLRFRTASAASESPLHHPQCSGEPDIIQSGGEAVPVWKKWVEQSYPHSYQTLL